MSKEEWKKLKESRGYLISSWGRIFSIKTERVLRPTVHQSRSNKYLRIYLKGKGYMVHVLVAHNFQPKQYRELLLLVPSTTIQVDHKDRNTLNPNNSNLRFVTESDNKIHMHETSVIVFGGKRYKSKLSKL